MSRAKLVCAIMGDMTMGPAIASPRPILRWAGSKRQIRSTLASYWSPKFARYVEPFCGSASLFAHIRPHKALLSDSNHELICSLSMMQQRPIDVFNALCHWAPTPETYYAVRLLKPTELGEVHRAARFIFLNRLCFNGLYRTNLKGEFNVPWGGERSGRLPTQGEIEEFGSLLTSAEIHCIDFMQIMSLVAPGDFVYLDPPYRVSAQRVFREYMPSGFGPNDIARLRSFIDELSKRDISFVLSYAESEEASSLAEGYYTQVVSVRRQIAGKNSSRAPARELIISNIGQTNDTGTPPAI